MSTARLFLMPAPLFELENNVIPASVQQQAVLLKYYFVENIRTARRVLKSYDKSVDIDAINFSLVNNKEAVDMQLFKQWVQEGHDIGIMSEAGMPAFADPGNILVSVAHDLGIEVVPLNGPSSLMLALVAAGMNGQSFEFHGYLPIEKSARLQILKQIDKSILQTGKTHIFIETPYRNEQMIDSILQTIAPQLKLCVGCNITAPDQSIQTKTIQQWKSKKASYDYHKKPCIFLIGQ